MDGEADLIGGFADDLDGDAGGVGDTLGSVGGVRERKLDEGKAAARRLQERHGAIAVLYGCGMHVQHRPAAVAVDHRVPLAAEHL